jgi:hypothetical protein
MRLPQLKLMCRQFIIFFLSIIFIATGYGQTNEIKGVTATGSTGVTISIGELQKLSDATPLPSRAKIRSEQEVERHLKNHPSSSAVATYPTSGISLLDLETTQTVHSNFQAISLSESGSVPPDCMGDVSETQVCIASNGRIKFYAKPSVCDVPLNTSIANGSASLGAPQFNIDMNVFFNAVRNNEETTDPEVRYDRITKRWFIIAINVANISNRMMIAVSNTADITAISAFTFYYFKHDEGTSPGDFDYQLFGDFPMFGLDKNALYIGALIFNTNGSYEGSSCYVIKKSSVISGGPLVFTAFRRVGSSGSGIFGPNPAYNDDPQATRGYYVGVNAGNYGILNYVIINDPGGTATTSTGSITVPTTSGPIEQVAKGSTNPLDGGDDRLLKVQMMKNKITGNNTIWTAHNVAVTVAGTANASGSNLRNAVRWYELNVNTSSLTLKQSGTWFDNTASNPMGYWMGSIAGSGQGHALAGASAAGTNKAANVVVAGRYNGQAAGQLSNTVFATNFNETYNVERDNKQRWGDYSQTVVDPSDNMTIWTFQEYTNATNSWGERATQFKAPPPATPIALTPVICNASHKSEVILTGQSAGNSGFFDPGSDEGGPGFSKHLRLTSTGNVSLSNIVFESPTQLRFTVDFLFAQPGSQQTLTITNPDCQSVTFNYTLPTGCDGQTVVRPIYVFPNPAKGSIKIRLANPGGVVRLLDVTGKLISVQNVTSTFMSIPAARLAKAIYIIEYINGSTKAHEKVLLE